MGIEGSGEIAWEKGGVPQGIAADLLWIMTSLRMWEDLVLEREWSPEQYQKYITNELIGALTSSRSE